MSQFNLTVKSVRRHRVVVMVVMVVMMWWWNGDVLKWLWWWGCLRCWRLLAYKICCDQEDNNTVMLVPTPQWVGMFKTEHKDVLTTCLQALLDPRKHPRIISNTIFSMTKLGHVQQNFPSMRFNRSCTCLPCMCVKHFSLQLGCMYSRQY